MERSARDGKVCGWRARRTGDDGSMGKYPVSWRVYRLFHESTPDTVYIGITSKTLEARRKQHFQSPLHAERNWIETLRATGQQPRICLVGCLDAAERFEAEQQE